ncbi:restriction endonuclease subunit S [Pseudomonas sp. FeS53a]|jgi:type I restriction enzyme S subunit|uniref:restriction endonuclease subunit S n=1 Tax=Pseudomonas sp. FeS53a TaxID=1604022 RepID=UPI0009E56321|nr:restriction endonuclease subunit S [Pseudomonas sp. FeS53a]
MSWPVVSLGEIFDIARGGSPRPIDAFITEEPDGVNWVMIGDASSGGKYISSTRKKIRKEGVSKSRMVHSGDFLLTNSMSFGRPYIMRTSGCIHDGWLVLKKKNAGVDEEFFYHLLGSDLVYQEFSRRAAGAIVKNLNIDLVQKVEVVFPPLGEQKRIATILDKADALRAKRRKALDQLDALAQAVFIEMFGADECPFFELGEALEFITSGGRGWAKYYSEQGARFIRSYDVQMNHISDAEPIYVAAPDNAEARRTIVRQGDVLLTITGSKIGRVSPVSKKFDGAYVSQHVAILRGDACRIDSDFLSYYLSLPAGGQRQIEKSQYGQTKPGLNFEQIKKFRVPDVSIEIQREFTRRLKAIEELRQAQTRHLVASESLFSSLQHRAFRGEL